jgi:hypothetical protein
VITFGEDLRELRSRVLEQRSKALGGRSLQQRRWALTVGDQTFEFRAFGHVIAGELPDQVWPPVRCGIEDGVDEALDLLPIVRWEIT